MIIKGDKLYLRPIDHSDAMVVLNWENNPSVWGVSGNDSPYSIEDIKNLINELQDVRLAKQARFIIVSSIEERPLGTIDLAPIDFEDGSSWVGVLVAEEADRMNGYGEEALKLLEIVSSKFGLSKLYAKIHTSNIASIRLFEKCGYQMVQNIRITENEQYIDTEIYLKCLKE